VDGGGHARLDLSPDAGVGGGPVSPVGDVSAGRWVVERTTGPWLQVGSLLPGGFAAYARIFHPAYRWTSDRDAAGEGSKAVRSPDGTLRWNIDVPWAEVAAANGRVAHPAMDWVTITGSERYLHGDRQPGVWDEEPREGSLPPDQSRKLISLLRSHTATPAHCWFALWDGFGNIAVPRDATRLLMPNRPMVMFSGPITGWVTHQEGDLFEQSPSLWWPEDRAWCVATDVDLMTTYLGASQACVRELTRSDGLEAMPITLDQPTTWDKDAVNPPARARTP